MLSRGGCSATCRRLFSVERGGDWCQPCCAWGEEEGRGGARGEVRQGEERRQRLGQPCCSRSPNPHACRASHVDLLGRCFSFLVLRNGAPLALGFAGKVYYTLSCESVLQWYGRDGTQ